ncbi:MAG: glycine zipper family protein [Lachnospiraceae bacterium]|nr:glycine zipper family protein [Lachnospiraceae bacterium]
MKIEKKKSNEEMQHDNKEGKTYWMPIGMCLGMSIGLAIGSATDHMSIFMVMGLAMGMLFGATLDSQNKNKDDEEKE